MFFKTNYRFIQVISIAECSKGNILQYFRPPLSYHLSLSIFEWPFHTGFTVVVFDKHVCKSNKQGKYVRNMVAFFAFLFNLYSNSMRKISNLPIQASRHSLFCQKSSLEKLLLSNDASISLMPDFKSSHGCKNKLRKTLQYIES